MNDRDENGFYNRINMKGSKTNEDLKPHKQAQADGVDEKVTGITSRIDGRDGSCEAVEVQKVPLLEVKGLHTFFSHSAWDREGGE